MYRKEGGGARGGWKPLDNKVTPMVRDSLTRLDRQRKSRRNI